MDPMDQLYDKFLGKIKHEAVKLKREAKRIAELETPLEKSLREATSNQNWGCPNSILYELALACQQYSDRQKILKKCWERLQSKEDKWRRVLKTLILIDYILKNGPEQAGLEIQGEQKAFRRLLSFKCVEEGQDRGAVIRDRAQNLLDLLTDRDRLKEEREKAKEHQSKLRQSSSLAPSSEGGGASAGGSGGGAGSSGGGGKLGGISRANFEERFNELKQKRDRERAERGHAGGDSPAADEGAPGGERRGREDEGRFGRREGERPGDGDRGAAVPKVAAPGSTGRSSGRPSRPEDSDSDASEGARPAAAPPLEDLLDLCAGPAPVAAAPPPPAAAAPVPPPAPAPRAASPGGLEDLLGEAPAAAGGGAVAAPGGAWGAAAQDPFGGFQGSSGPGFAATPGLGPGPCPPGPCPPAPWAAPPAAAPALAAPAAPAAPAGGGAAGAAPGRGALDLEDAFELALGGR